jgi:hypothetical protein
MDDVIYHVRVPNHCIECILLFDATTMTSREGELSSVLVACYGNGSYLL